MEALGSDRMNSLGRVGAGLGGFKESHTEETMSEAMTQMTQKEAPSASDTQSQTQARAASLIAQATERSAPCIARFLSSPHHVPRKFMFAVALAVANLQRKQRALLPGSDCPNSSVAKAPSPSFRLQQQLVDSSPMQVTYQA